MDAVSQGQMTISWLRDIFPQVPVVKLHQELPELMEAATPKVISEIALSQWLIHMGVIIFEAMGQHESGESKGPTSVWVHRELAQALWWHLPLPNLYSFSSSVNCFPQGFVKVKWANLQKWVSDVFVHGKQSINIRNLPFYYWRKPPISYKNPCSISLKVDSSSIWKILSRNLLFIFNIN